MKISSYGLHQFLLLKKQSIYSIITIGMVGLVGFLLTITQIFGNSPDYLNYDVFFDFVRLEGLGTLALTRFEPGFSVLVIFLIKFLASNLVVYSWIVFAAMILKGYAIRSYAASNKIFLVCIGFYLVRYFALHELTQLRVACAIALILVGAIFLWKGSLRCGLLFCASAILFQMSAVAIIPALFITASKPSKAIIIALLVFALTWLYSSLLTGYLATYVPILNSYKANGFSDIKPNPFAIQLLIDWVIIFFSLVMWSRLTLLMKRIVLIELIGMAIFYGGIELGVIAHRMREFYSVLWVFFVADGLRLKAIKLIIYGFVFICIVFYSYVFFISGKFFH